MQLHILGRSAFLTGIIFLMVAQTVLSQSFEPLTLNLILNGLQETSGKFTLSEKNEFIAQDVKERGVNFILKPNIERKLRIAGANGKLIKAIRERNSKDIIIVGKGKSAKTGELFENAIESGNTARDTRNYAAAEAAYRRAQRLNPDDWRASYGIGNIFSDQQRWEEAEKAYRQAIELEPKSSKEPIKYIALSYVLTQLISETNSINRYLEAERMASRAIELDKNSALAYSQRGATLELLNRLSEAEASYRKALELDPESAVAFAYLGRLLRRSGKFAESVKANLRAIQLATDVPTMIFVADVLQSQQKFDESTELLRHAIREDEKNPTALFLLGRTLTNQGAFAEAETVLKKLIEVSPKSLASYLLLGLTYSRRGDFNEAENILKRALQIVSENEKKRLAQAFETVGDKFFSVGKKKDAIRVYQQATTLDKGKMSLTEKINMAQQN